MNSGRIYPIKYYGADDKKHAKCPICGRDWLIGRKGGGLVYGAAIRHTRSHEKKEDKNEQTGRPDTM